jgi:Ras-related GTP-binding protein A/B
MRQVSNIIKQFKLSCSKSQAQLCSMQVRNSTFSALIDGFTATTYIMVVTSDPDALPAATLVNINNAREHFDRLNVGLN